jgi:hypothetical protein
MKKLLGIVVLYLLLSGNAFSLTKEEAIKQFLSNKKLEPIEGIWISDQGRIIVNYKKGNNYFSKVIYSAEVASGSDQFDIRNGSSNSLSGSLKCFYNVDKTEWGKKKSYKQDVTCKETMTAINSNILNHTTTYPPNNSIGFAGYTATSKWTRIWPTSLEAHNNSFKSKDELIEEDKKLANIINDAKKTCTILGFKEESEKFADCTLKLYTQKVEELVAEKQLKNQQIIASQSSSSTSSTSSNQSSGSNVTTINDPVRDSQNLINKGQKMLSGGCTLGVDC